VLKARIKLQSHGVAGVNLHICTENLREMDRRRRLLVKRSREYLNMPSVQLDCRDSFHVRERGRHVAMTVGERGPELHPV
jgi:hypothetical protein